MKSAPVVLLVEDSQDDVYFFQRALKRSGVPCHLVHALDGSAAIGMLREGLADGVKLPDVVFLDLKMPVMTGFEVLAWIREQTFAASLRVVVLSGSDQQSDQRRARQLGAADFLVKPVNAAVLAQQLQGLSPVDESKVCDH